MKKSITRLSLRYLSKIWYLLVRPKDVLVLGDSHTLVFRCYFLLFGFLRYRFRMDGLVGGATAYGLDKPDSKTQSMKIMTEALNRRSYSYIIVQLGEVDIGRLIWVRAEKYGKPAEEMLDQSIEVYQQFLLNSKSYAPLIVISTPLPVLADEDMELALLEERRNLPSTQRERTNLTLYFNDKIKSYCENNDITYIHLDDESLSADGLVTPRLRSMKKKGDHHYSWTAYARMLTPKLRRALKKI